MKARRQRILFLVSYSNKENTIVEQVCKEFSCSKAVAKKDLKKLGLWAQELQKSDQIGPVFSARMDSLYREAVEIVVDDDVSDSTKLKAIDSASRISVEQAKFRYNITGNDHKPVEVAARFSVGTPCEADPKLKEALAELVEKQRAEKKMRVESAQAVKVEDEKDSEKPSNTVGA